MRNSNYSFLREVFSTMGHAMAAAAAVRRRQQPMADDLRGLGIDPAEFRKIKL